MGDLYDELEFPLRAEYLDQYKNYQVDVAHWRDLAEQFQKAFRQVYSRRSAVVLLVHGPQGSGKSMFCARLAEDYKRTREGAFAPDLRNNLWHILVAPDKPEEAAIQEVTKDTALQLVDERKDTDWFSVLKQFAAKDESRVRVFLCDDAHKDGMVRPLTNLQPTDFYEIRQARRDALLGLVAERLNDACRHEFQRSIFVMLSNDKDWLDTLRGKLESWFKELAVELSLPVPAPPTLERIVRINTNRLNKVSYWYCLDAAKAERRMAVRSVLMEGSGFTDSFHAVSKSLDSESRRQGRPGNRNVLTLVTLGAEPAAVQEFLEDRDIAAEMYHVVSARHVGIWDMWNQWASRVEHRPDRESLRWARMMESEFVLRWVSLDMVATRALLEPPAAGDLGEQLMRIILRRPSIGTPNETLTGWRTECAGLEGQLERPPFAASEVERLAEDFKRLGQRRSTLYEPAIGKRVTSTYSRGFEVYRSLRPDIIVADPAAPDFGEYKACVLTSAASESSEDIAAAIRRTGHSIEFTAFLREDLAGLEDYLVGKIKRYAEMLESV